MKNETSLLLVAILAVGVGIFIVGLQSQVQPNITVQPSKIDVLRGTTDLNASCTHSIVSVSATATLGATTQVLAANYSASYRRLQNTGNTMVSCQLDSPTTSLAVGTGIILYSSSSVNSIYEIGPDNLYKKVILCLSETSTGTISVVQCY